MGATPVPVSVPFTVLTAPHLYDLLLLQHTMTSPPNCVLPKGMHSAALPFLPSTTAPQNTKQTRQSSE